jgi:hypothetical protein
MKRVVMCVVVMILWVAQAQADEWATTDKVLLGTYITLSAVDAAQTHWALRHGYHEENPLLGNDPSDARIIGTKVVSGLLIGSLAEVCEPCRRTVLIIANVVEISVVAHNVKIGVRIGW